MVLYLIMAHIVVDISCKHTLHHLLIQLLHADMKLSREIETDVFPSDEIWLMQTVEVCEDGTYEFSF